MARNTFPSPSSWIPEEYGSEVLTRVSQSSGVEAFARRIPMSTDTKATPRMAGVGVEVIARGAVYGEDTSANDEVILTTRKFGKIVRLADEDLADSPIDIITQKQNDWAISYAKEIDNSCLATTAAASGTTVPFNSVYYSLSQTNSAVGYTANANIVKTAGALTYSHLTTVLSKLEAGDYNDDSRTVVIAHPAFKNLFRGLVDGQGRPLFVDAITAGTPDTVLGFPVVWSNGAKTSAVASAAPTGNPIMVIANRDFLLFGVRSGPETAFAPADSGAGFNSDEALLKLRARRAFALGNENAAAILEITAS